MMILTIASGCGRDSGEVSQNDSMASPAVNLVYYTIGDPDRDLDMVNDELNRLLMDKIGITVTYKKVAWDNYEAQLRTLISTGKTFDVAYTANAAYYSEFAQKGAWLALDSYLETTGSEMYDVIDPVFWEGVSINGHIYGVPTNKELAVQDQWMFAEELITKYNINVEDYTTLASLEPVFDLIHTKEPDYLVMELDKIAHNYFSRLGYEYVTDKTMPLMVKSFSDNYQIINPFDDEECVELLRTIRRYYELGYINEDASVRPSSTLEKDEKVFFKIASGGPYAESIWSQQRGYSVVATAMSEAVVTTESTRAGVVSINAASEHPEESVAFLNCLNTDAEVRNLLAYGIEGEHYQLSDEGQVLMAEDPGYSSVNYTQGNWFILNTLGGDNGEPLDKWDTYKQYNSETIKSSTLCFTPNLSNLTQEVEQVNRVVEKYYSAIMTGTVDLDVFLPRFNEELENAGLEKIRMALQEQLDVWLSAK